MTIVIALRTKVCAVAWERTRLGAGQKAKAGMHTVALRRSPEQDRRGVGPWNRMTSKARVGRKSPQSQQMRRCRDRAAGVTACDLQLLDLRKLAVDVSTVV